MRASALALVATAGVLLAASLLFGGGSSEGPVAWIGGAAVLAAAAAGCAALWGVLPVPAIGREGLVCAGLAAAFVVWNAVTILWSSAPDRSWGYFNRGLVYLAFGVVGAFVGSAVAPRIVAWLVGGLVTATCLWALAGKAIPALYEDYGRLARLRSPVGYWNALALVAALGIPIALWAATRHSRRVRAGAVVALYALLVALVLTYSRGGILAALVAIAAWFALSRERFEGATAFVAAAVPAGLLLVVAIQLPGVAEDAQPRPVRVDDGAWFALLFVLGACLAFAAAYFVRYRPGPERERLLLKGGCGRRRRPACRRPGRGARRGWQSVRKRPADRPGPEPVDRGEPQQPVGLVEGGLGGLRGPAASRHGCRARSSSSTASFGTTTSTCARCTACRCSSLPSWGSSASCSRAARSVPHCSALGGRSARLDGDERAAAIALAVALPTFLVHGALDYDWDFVALCGPLFFISGVLLATGRSPLRVGRKYAWVAVVVLVAWAGLYSIAAPRVAAARVDDAFAQLERGDVEQAARTAKSAHSLDPLSIAPLEAWAAAEEANGKIARARELYVRGGRPPAAELGRLVRARALRLRGARGRGRRAARARAGARARSAERLDPGRADPGMHRLKRWGEARRG